MNKLNNKEKKLWEDCLKETIPSPPSKDESWILLKKQIEIHNQKPFYAKLFNYKPNFTYFHQKFVYATIILLIILSIESGISKASFKAIEPPIEAPIIFTLFVICKVLRRSIKYEIIFEEWF